MSVDAAYIDARAIVDSPHVGSGTRIWEFVHVLAGARISRDCNINSHVFVEDDVVIGDEVTVKCGVCLWNGVRLEDRVFVGPNVRMGSVVTRDVPDHVLVFGNPLRRAGGGCFCGAKVASRPRTCRHIASRSAI